MDYAYLLLGMVGYLLSDGVCAICMKKQRETISGQIDRPDKNAEGDYDCAEWILPHTQYGKTHSLVIQMVELNLGYWTNDTNYKSAGLISVGGGNLADNSTGDCHIYHPQRSDCSVSGETLTPCTSVWHHYGDIGDDVKIEYKPSRKNSRRSRKWNFSIEYEYIKCEADQQNLGAVGAAITFGMISALEALVLIAVALRYKKGRNIDARGNNATVAPSTNTHEARDCGGDLDPDPVYQTVENLRAEMQPETVVNEIYTMT
ncbi:uncharacterized protein LOC120331973 [Styela clava]